MTGTDQRKLVPIMRVVKAAIADTGGDIGQLQQSYLHWCSRLYKDLNRQVLKGGKRYALLPVNQNTHTATLPVDFNRELFVGVIDARGMKLELPSNDRIANRHNIETIIPSEKCTVCGQATAVCEDLQITETSNLIEINGSTYEQKIIKKLYPNGDYYLETTTPYFNVNTSDIDYNTTKEFIDHLDLKPCGCLDDTEANLNVLKNISPDAYCCYYAGCDSCCSTDLGSYRIFEENGLIQFDYNFKFDKVYIEYEGSMPKVNGQLAVPEVAFETLVEGTIFKSMKARKNISNPDKQFQWNLYTVARRNMEKILGQVSLASIINAATRVPKFDISYQTDWYSCFDWQSRMAKAVPATAIGAGAGVGTGTDGGGGNTGGGGGTVTIINNVENDTPPSLIVNGQSFNSEGTYAAPLDRYKNLDFLIFWNGIRYLTRNEYLVDPTNALVTILIGNKPFSTEDNYILIPNGKITA